MTRNVNDLLYERVCNAQSLNDIIPILNLIPMQEIQNALLDVIRGLDTNVVNKVHYEGLSLIDILPDDVTQQIVSFSDSIQMKRVNKAFYTCYNKNRERELKQRQSIIDKYEFDPLVKYDERNKTWIVHPTRTLLNSEEIAKGYHGPLRRLQEVIDSDSVGSGDKLLFYDGCYVFTEDESYWLMGKDLQLIGIGDNVRFKIHSVNLINELRNEDYEEVEPLLSDPGSLYFQNITIDMLDPVCIMMGSVCMEDCTLISDIKVKGGTFNAKCCLFNGAIQRHGSPIWVSQWVHSEVNIIGCTFTNHKQTCILLGDDVNTSGADERTTSAIKCVANIFRNNFSYPIATVHLGRPPDEFKVKQEQKSTIMYNILEGHNGTHMGKLVDAANEIISGLWRSPPYAQCI